MAGLPCPLAHVEPAQLGQHHVEHEEWRLRVEREVEAQIRTQLARAQLEHDVAMREFEARRGAGATG